jgi:hypothetical protein
MIFLWCERSKLCSGVVVFQWQRDWAVRRGKSERGREREGEGERERVGVSKARAIVKGGKNTRAGEQGQWVMWNG